MLTGVEGTIVLECENCQRKHSIEGSDCRGESVESVEGGMGPSVKYDIPIFNEECDCGNEIDGRVSVWEYPVGCLNYQEPNIKGAKVAQNDFDFKFEQ